MDPLALAQDLASRIQTARQDGDSAPVTLTVAEALLHAQRLAEGGEPAAAENVLRALLISVDPTFMLARHELGHLVNLALVRLMAMADELPSGDPGRRRFLHFFMELLAVQLQAGGAGATFDTLLFDVPRLVRPEERQLVRWTAREWMPRWADAERRFELKYWSEFLRNCHPHLPHDEEAVKAVEAEGFHHLHLHVLLEEARLDEAAEIAVRHLDESVWEELGGNVVLEMIAEAGELPRLRRLLQEQWKPPLSLERQIVLDEVLELEAGLD